MSRFALPWRVEDTPSGFRVVDANGMPLAWVYATERVEPAARHAGLTRTEAQRLAQAIAERVPRPPRTPRA